ncbi:RNA polymerase sigma factor SigJ [Kitasatospora sp. Ki12]
MGSAVRSDGVNGLPEQGVGAIMGERRRLINLAYRLLGSSADAEDVVRETYARWYAMPRREREAIGSPGGWLTTVASRICLNVLGSDRVRREWAGAGPVAAADPADVITLDESVGMVSLVVLESMAPAERVAFVLHDVFQYPFAEVAAVVGRSSAACRQLAFSARHRIRVAQEAAPPVGFLPVRG